MGVVRRDVVEKETVVSTDDLIFISDEEPVPIVQTPVKNAKRNIRKKNPGSPMDYAKTSGRKAKGSRASRRYENLNYLVSLTENEEFGELDITDFVEPSVSAFATLFMEQEKMKIWNDFINQSEEDQDRLLKKGQMFVKEDKNANDSGTKLDAWEIVPDLREAHPAYSAKECFNRIDNNLKTVLRRRQFPKGTLASIEEDLVSFFLDYPTSVFVYKLGNSYERLLLHAVCQYMDLQSHSYFVDGIRHTQVENKNNDFMFPDLPLSEFIEMGFEKSIAAKS